MTLNPRRCIRGESASPDQRGGHSSPAQCGPIPLDVTIPPDEVDAVPIGDATLLEQEARIVGIKGFSTPTLEAVDRRRSQLWTVVFAGLVCLSAAVALLTSKAGHRLGFANGIGFRVGTVVLV